MTNALEHKAPINHRQTVTDEEAQAHIESPHHRVVGVVLDYLSRQHGEQFADVIQEVGGEASAARRVQATGATQMLRHRLDLRESDKSKTSTLVTGMISFDAGDYFSGFDLYFWKRNRGQLYASLLKVNSYHELKEEPGVTVSELAHALGRAADDPLVGELLVHQLVTTIATVVSSNGNRTNII